MFGEFFVKHITDTQQISGSLSFELSSDSQETAVLYHVLARAHIVGSFFNPVFPFADGFNGCFEGLGTSVHR
jgi:hypothetical protein